MRHGRGDRCVCRNLLIFDWLSTLGVYMRENYGFGYLARPTVDSSTVLPSTSDSTKEVGISYQTATALYQDFLRFQHDLREGGWKEARKAEGEFSEVPTSLQRLAGQSLRTLQ